MLVHAVEGSLRVLDQDQSTVIIQRKGLVDRTAADMVALTPQPAGAPQIPPR